VEEFNPIESIYIAIKNLIGAKKEEIDTDKKTK
jgi:hypothetical protein